MLNGLRTKKALDLTINILGRERIRLLGHKQNPRYVEEAIQKLEEAKGTIGARVDAYIERLEIEAEILERLDRRLRLIAESISPFMIDGAMRPEREVYRDILKTIKTITEEVKADAEKKRQ